MPFGVPLVDSSNGTVQHLLSDWSKITRRSERLTNYPGRSTSNVGERDDIVASGSVAVSSRLDLEKDTTVSTVNSTLVHATAFFLLTHSITSYTKMIVKL